MCEKIYICILSSPFFRLDGRTSPLTGTDLLEHHDHLVNPEHHDHVVLDIANVDLIMYVKCNECTWGWFGVVQWLSSAAYRCWGHCGLRRT